MVICEVYSPAEVFDIVKPERSPRNSAQRYPDLAVFLNKHASQSSFNKTHRAIVYTRFGLTSAEGAAYD